MERVVEQRAVYPDLFGPRVDAERVAIPQNHVSHLAGLQAAGHLVDADRLGGIVAEPGPGDLVRDLDSGSATNGERSEEHTSELQSLMRISYAVFCLKQKNKP